MVERRCLSFVNAELNYWNVGLWIDVTQNRPCTVVKSPPVVAAHRNRCKQLLYTGGQVGITGSGVLYPVQLAWKAAEIVDRPWRGAQSDRSVFDIPVSRDR